MFVNAHTHLYSGLAPFGMPPPVPPPENFVQNLQRVWWRLDRALDEASLRAGARWYVAQARRAGTVALVDHHESPNLIEGSLDVLADACAGFGMAAVLCYGATERNGGRDEAMRGLEECRRFIRENRRSRIAGVVGLHASFTVSDETIREAGLLCEELGTVLQIHLAEDGADVRDARERGYAGPLQRLMALGALPPGSILVHGVHLSAEEVVRASDAGCWFVQNPQVEPEEPRRVSDRAGRRVARRGGHRRLPVEYGRRGGGAGGDVGRGRRTARRDRRSPRCGLGTGGGATRRLPGAPGRRGRHAPVGRRHGGDRRRGAGAGFTPLGEMVEKIRRHP